MVIQQLSVFLEDRKGRLTEITGTLAENGINISAFSIADAPEYGILRMVVGKPELALKILKEKGFSVKLTEVACIVVPNKPGGLFKALKILSENDITIDYMYAFALEDKASVVIRAASIENVIEVLQKNKMELIGSDRIYQV